MSDRFPHVREPSSGEPDICIYCREEWVDLLTLYERDECSVRLRAEVERLRSEVSYLRACVPPTHPSDYGHEAWAETVRTAVAAERAAVVAWLRREVDNDADSACILAYAANGIERGEHLKETQMTTEQSCYTCRWARGDVCDHPPCSEDMDVGIDGYALAAGCLKNKGMPLDRTIDCPGHERGEHRREEE